MDPLILRFYSEHDITEVQARVLEQIRKQRYPDGQKIVETLVDHRAEWSGIESFNFDPSLTIGQFVNDSYYADGIRIGLCAEANLILVPALEKIEGCSVRLLHSERRPSAAAAPERTGTLPDEATTFLEASWDRPEVLDWEFNQVGA